MRPTNSRNQERYVHKLKRKRRSESEVYDKVKGEDSTSFVASNLIDRSESEELLMYAAAGFYLGVLATLHSMHF